MHDGDALTSGWRQAKRSAAASSPRSPLLMLVFGFALTAAGLMAFHMLLSSLTVAPTPVPASPPTRVPASFVPASAATYPPVFLAMAESVATAFAPTPSPTPTYAALPTPRPLVCETEGSPGETCEWAKSTPTATPGLPVCRTPVPGETCLMKERQ